MKTALIIIVTVCCGYLIGNTFATRLKMRCIVFEEMLMLINYFENMILYKDMSVNDLVLSATKSGEYKHLTFLEAASKTDGDFNEKWTKSVTNSDLKNYLSNENINEFVLIGSGLGKTDKNGQISHLNLHKEILKNRLTNADEEKNKKGEMYKKVGALLGVAAAIVIV